MRLLRTLGYITAFFILIYLFFSLLGLLQFGNQIPYDNPPYESSKWTEINEIELHYRKYTAQDAIAGILLIHGFSGSTYSWEKTIPALNHAGYDVVAVDLPAFGYSSRKRGIKHHNKIRAKLLWTFLNQIHPEQKSWIIAGHSMGGGVAAAMSTVNPQNTTGVVLVAGALFSPGQESSVRPGILFSIPLLKESLSGIARLFFFRESTVERLLKSAYGNPPEQADVEAYLRPLKIRGTALAILDMLHAQVSGTTMTFSIESPLLIIWGDADEWVPLKYGYEIKKLFPHAKMVVLEGVGHNPMETHPKAFLDAMLIFLEDELSAD